MSTSLTITRIYAHPVKGCRGNIMGHAHVDPYGLTADRRFMLAAGGRYLSQRRHPQLAHLGAVLEQGVLVLSDHEDLGLNYPHQPIDGPLSEVTMPGGGTSHGIDQGDFVADWLRRCLGTECRLLMAPPADQLRQVDQRFGGPGDRTALTDAWPLLLINRASLDVLQRLAPGLTDRHLRPNFVVDGLGPWKEDELIGQEFEVVGRGMNVIFDKPCDRCVATQVNLALGQAGGPATLKALAEAGRHQVEPTTGEPGLMFGVNLRVKLTRPRLATIWQGDRLVPVE